MGVSLQVDGPEHGSQTVGEVMVAMAQVACK